MNGHSVATSVRAETRAALVVVSGVSGVGKTELCSDRRCTVLSLDSFYRRPSDELPRWGWGGQIDWEHPETYDLGLATEALERLLREGRVEVPIFDIATDSVIGMKSVQLTGDLVIAEGVWGPAVAAALDSHVSIHVLLVRSPIRVAIGRLTRDVAMRNKSGRVAFIRTSRLLLREPRYRRWAIRNGAVKANAQQARVLLSNVRPKGGSVTSLAEDCDRNSPTTTD